MDQALKSNAKKAASSATQTLSSMDDMMQKYAAKLSQSSSDFVYLGKMSTDNMLNSLLDNEIDDIAEWMHKKHGWDISTGSKKDKAVIQWVKDAFGEINKMGYEEKQHLKDIANGLAKPSISNATKSVSQSIKSTVSSSYKKNVIKNAANDDKLLNDLLDKFKNQTTDKMLSIGNKELERLTEDQFEVLRSYTGNAYTKINDYLRKIARGEKPSAWLDKDTIDSIDDTVKAFSSIKTKEDYALRRGTDADDIFYTFLSGNPSMKDKINSLVTSLEDDLFAPGGGVNEAKLQEHIDEISSLIKGQTGNFASFTSTSSSWDKGFKGDVEYVIDAPKGTAGTSIMSISNFGTSEGEFLLAPGTKVICEKVEAARDGHKRALVKVFLKILV